VYNSFDIERASENCSVKTVEFFTCSQKMTGKQIISLKRDSLFNEAFMLFTCLSLLVTRRCPELGVHCRLTHALPIMGDMKVEELNRLSINRLINYLVIDEKFVQSRRVFSLMEQCLSWCECQGVIERSPLTTMSLNKVVGRLKPKMHERILSDEELEKFWHMREFSDESESTHWAAPFILCSARRPDEVLRPRCDEFDLRNDVRNQGDRNKSGLEHSLPISPIMRSCIDKMMDATGNSEWLITSPKTEIKPTSKVMIAQASRRIMSKNHLIDHLNTPYKIRELRINSRSKLPRLGVGQDVVRKIMNHILKGINGVYNRHNHMDKMVEAMYSYSNFLVDKYRIDQLVSDT